MRQIFTTAKLSSFIVAVLLVAFFVTLAPTVARASDKETTDLPLYPLKKGLKWEFKNESNGWVTEITDIVKIDKLACYEMGGKDDLNTKNFYAVTDDGLLHVRSTGLKSTQPKPLISHQMDYVPPLCMLKPASDKTALSLKRYKELTP